MKRILILIAFGLLVLHLPGGRAQNVRMESATTAKSTRADQRGALFRVRHQGHTSYLFGTIHVGKPSFYPLGVEVMQAFSQASSVAVELDSQNTEAVLAAMRKYGMYRADDNIQHHLTPATFAHLKRTLARASIPLQNVIEMKPWLVATLLLAEDIKRSGYGDDYGIDSYLLNITKKSKKKVVELESADLQFSLFNDMSEQQQSQFLEETMAEIKSGKARKELASLAEAWYHADAEALSRLTLASLSEKSLGAEFMQRVLLDQRNPEMARKIALLLQQDEVSFVGIGLLHLIGDHSVPMLLQQRGYEVERVY